ncbi:unnamed protein product [Spirodela intermedia]|uniref:Uncharacterized protein n=1 Tax=Spirodela intermedia TaxID=51605 RepID=A0A7I8KMV3_SPIIN|nr:unnamed protein product [Spirodela intermedia]
MAAESNMGFQQRTLPSFFHNRHMVSFQSGAVNSSNRIVPTVTDSFGAVDSTSGMTFSGNPGGGNTSLLIPPERTSGVLHLDPFPELKHDTGLAVFWSFEEQLLLEDGLAKYSNEPNIRRYIKIAATLHNKTVRDVALRCRWMTNDNRRRRNQEYSSGKMMKDNKVKQMDYALGGNAAPNRLLNVPSRSVAAHHPECSSGVPYEASCISCPMRQLLDDNDQVLWQIKDNLDTLKLQDNLSLLFHAKNNLTAILDRMSKAAGLNQMTPLPIAVDESLFSKFLHGSSQLLL